MDAQTLIAQGYRRVSNKSRTIARIDRADWVYDTYFDKFGHTDIGIAQAVRTFYEGKSIEDFGFMKDSVLYEAKCAADHYRRCMTKDRVTDVPVEIFRDIPTSSWDEIGFCEK